MISIIDYGDWTPYIPDTKPNDLPDNVMFCRNNLGTDWYSLAHGQAFAQDSVVMTALRIGSIYKIQAASRDPQKIFPQNCRLIEVRGVTEIDPQAVYGGQIYDPGSLTISPAPARQIPVITAKADIWRRASDIEAEAIVRVLEQQSIRRQRMFSDAQYIDHSDSEFDDLRAGFVAAFGQERADELLASSD